MYIWGARKQAKRGMGEEATAAMIKMRDLVTFFMSARVDSMEQSMATRFRR